MGELLSQSGFNREQRPKGYETREPAQIGSFDRPPSRSALPLAAVVAGGISLLMLPFAMTESAENPSATTLIKPTPKAAEDKREPTIDWQSLSDADWQKRLTPEQHYVMRRHGTERAFTGTYWNNHQTGIYVCAGCELPLYSSSTKFDSGTGWPSFWDPAAKDAVETREDRSFFSVRTEVHCRRCQSHLGHVFNDGPAPTGMRHCINSASLKFVPEKSDPGSKPEKRKP